MTTYTPLSVAEIERPVHTTALDLEWSAGTVYIGDPHHCFVSFTKHYDIAIITNVMGTVKLHDFKEMFRLFRQMGIETVCAYRNKHRSLRYVELRLEGARR